MDFDIPVGRVYLPDKTYVGCVVRSRANYVEILAPKTFEVLADIQADQVTFVGGPAETADPQVLARWQIEGPDGVHWLSEHTTGCGCSGLAVGGPEPGRLEW